MISKPSIVKFANSLILLAIFHSACKTYNPSNLLDHVSAHHLHDSQMVVPFGEIDGNNLHPITSISAVRNMHVVTADTRGAVTLWSHNGAKINTFSPGVAARAPRISTSKSFIASSYPDLGVWLWQTNPSGHVARLMSEGSQEEVGGAVSVFESNSGSALIALVKFDVERRVNRVSSYRVESRSQQQIQPLTTSFNSANTQQVDAKKIIVTEGPPNFAFMATGPYVEIHRIEYAQGNATSDCIGRIEFVDKPNYGRPLHTTAELASCMGSGREPSAYTSTVKDITSLAVRQNRETKAFDSKVNFTIAVGTNTGQVLVIDEVRLWPFELEGKPAVGKTTTFDPLMYVARQSRSEASRHQPGMTPEMALDRCSPALRASKINEQSRSSDHKVIVGLDFNNKGDRLVATSSFGSIHLLHVGSVSDRLFLTRDVYPALKSQNVIKSHLQADELKVIGNDQILNVHNGISIPPARFINDQDDVVFANAMGRLFTWKTKSARQPRTIAKLPAETDLKNMALSVDGKYLATADGRGHVAVWPVDGQTQGAFGPQPLAHRVTESANPVVQFTRGGQYVLMIDKKAKFWRWQDDTFVAEFGKEGATAAALMPDEQHVIIGYEDGKFEVYNVKSRELVYQQAFNGKKILTIKSLRSSAGNQISSLCPTCFAIQDASGAVGLGEFLNKKDFKSISDRRSDGVLTPSTHARFSGELQFIEYLPAVVGNFVMVAENFSGESRVRVVFDQITARDIRDYRQDYLAPGRGMQPIRGIHLWGDDTLIVLRPGLLENWSVDICEQMAMRSSPELSSATVLAVDYQRRFIVTGSSDGHIRSWFMDDEHFLDDLLQ